MFRYFHPSGEKERNSAGKARYDVPPTPAQPAHSEVCPGQKELEQARSPQEASAVQVAKVQHGPNIAAILNTRRMDKPDLRGQYREFRNSSSRIFFSVNGGN
jgi:hypothetical protein